MSWDIILFNSNKKITSIEEVDESELINIDFDTLLFEFFQDNLIDKGNFVKIVNSEYNIEYFKDDEFNSNKMLNLYGEKAIYDIAKFAQKYNFQIFDTGIEKMLDLENPQKNGYENFQNYLNQITDETEE